MRLAVYYRSLDKITEGKRLDRSDFGSLATRCLQEVRILGGLGLTLQIYLDSSLSGLLLCSLVFLSTLDNLLLALGFSYVLNTHMDTLFDDASVHQLVHAHTDGGLGDIKDNTSASVVTLVGHTFVNGGVGKDVHVISHLDVHQVLRKVNGAMLTELLGEHVARTRPDTVRVRHLAWFLQSKRKQRRQIDANDR